MNITRGRRRQSDLLPQVTGGYFEGVIDADEHQHLMRDILLWVSGEVQIFAWKP
jgi:hypothetical protein